MLKTTNIKQETLDEALLECQEAAQRGYKIAKHNLEQTSSAIETVSKSLTEFLKGYEVGSVRTPGIVEQLKKQIDSVANELEQLQSSNAKNLEERRKRLDHFSITLFGRTMAGKSTLMEILTRGDGKSIGLGAQRTTRDVRSYQWKGLKITDVPGIAAFEGVEDEELAFKAAIQADLVLFLITDDAPQPVEAECFARVRSLGKPILGICNVKTTVDDEDDMMLFLRKPERSFDMERINELLNQFYSFVKQYNSGKRVPFVKTHLRSRFIAELPEFAENRENLLHASRFEDVELGIIREIKDRGTFLRTKSFIDGAVVPMIELMNMLLDFSAQNSASGRVLISKRKQFKDWSQSFKTDGTERIKTFISKLMDDLREDVSDFSEEHYEDRYAGEKWERHINSTGINEKIKKVQTIIMNECSRAISEVSRELQKELSFVAKFSADRDIKMNRIVDSKRWLNWGTLSLSGGLGIVALVIGSSPIGLIATGVGVAGWVISLFLESREKKVRQGREKLSEKLHTNIDKMERALKQQLLDWFYNELLVKQIYVLLNDLGVITNSIFELADAQRSLAWTLNDRQKELERILIEEALRNANAEELIHYVCDIARVPGSATMFLIDPTTHFPKKIKKHIEYLLGENIWFVIDNGNEHSLLSQAIGRGCSRNKISIEEKLKVAHIPINELDVLTLLRAKLAQQLSGLHVMQ